MAKVPYMALATLLVEARQQAGLTQRALAKVLGVKQQSVSRWEAGTHRPAIDQIEGLATALSVNQSALLEHAGIASPPLVVTAPLLPLQMLTPEMFERFVADLASLAFEESTVRLQGGRGHAQDGWDVLVELKRKTIGIQCKQVERFGPAEVRKVFAGASRPVDERILALSRIGSPSTADILGEHGWKLWDQDDLSRLVRHLPGEEQDRLVDIFFSGRRRELLGRDNPSPWLRPDRFFAPFDRRGGALTHAWTMVGRERELESLVEALSAKASVVLLTAAGGMGKSRLLKEAVERFHEAHPATKVRFLSAAGEVGRADLEALGGGPKLIVVDDAHDRDGLPLLIEFAADEANEAQLLLAARPYAEQRIRNDLARFAILSPRTITLDILPEAAIRTIAENALEEFQAPRSAADLVLYVAQDNPLVAVMASRVIAEDTMPVELVRSAADIRRGVISGFTEVLEGKIADPEDRRHLRDLLRLIALLQPVAIDDREIGALLGTVAGHHEIGTSRMLRLLVEGGIVYKRGRWSRLMPDLLGDYLIDEGCIQADGRLSRFAESVVTSAPDRLLPHVMINLGRLDWRRHSGDPSDSQLLDVVWHHLRGIEFDWDPRLEAVRSVAVYQPAQALRFVRERLGEGKAFSEAPSILANIAYTDRYRDEALGLLWEIGRGDMRSPGQNPGHAMRVLAELAEYGEHKPREFNEAIAAFAFRLMDDPKAFDGPHTPIDIVKPLLSGTIEQTRSRGRTITLSSMFVRYEYAEPLRKAVIDRLIALLEHPVPRVAAVAASALEEAVRHPYGLGGAAPDAVALARYDREFAATISRAAKLGAKGALAPATLLRLADAVHWHAEFGRGRPHSAARKLIRELPTSLHFRLRAAMTNQARFALGEELEGEDWHEKLPERLQALAREIKQCWPDPTALLDEIEAGMRDLLDAGIGDDSAYLLLNALVIGDLRLATALLDRASSEPESLLRPYVSPSLTQMLDDEPAAGRRRLTHYLEADAELARRAISALGSLKRPLEPADTALLRRALESDHVPLARSAISTLHWLPGLPDAQVQDLLLAVAVDRDPDLLNDVATVIMGRRRHLLAALSDDQIDRLLQRLGSVRELDGHWVEELLRGLGERSATKLADFLVKRTEGALSEKDEGVDLLSYRFADGKLAFHKSPDAASLLEKIWTWMRTHDNDEGYKIYRIAEFVSKLFDVNSELVVRFFDARLSGAGPLELKWMAKVLRHAHHSFPFKQLPFVERFLERAAAVDPDAHSLAVEMLTTAAVTGMKSGTLGEPMPRDLEARDRATEALKELGAMSPARRLYEAILDDAKRDIARAIRDGQAYDEEEVA
ncbi:MAG TPA: helix-turn-helix domain-containing protein [Sphingomicrobium sp.]|nr:helix-turn-helix domain-containing protein [Sphingomicrobium sp.]